MSKYVVSYTWQLKEQSGTGDIQYSVNGGINSFEDVNELKRAIREGDTFVNSGLLNPTIVLVNIIPIPIKTINPKQ